VGEIVCVCVCVCVCARARVPRKPNAGADCMPSRSPCRARLNKSAVVQDDEIIGTELKALLSVPEEHRKAMQIRGGCLVSGPLNSARVSASLSEAHQSQLLALSFSSPLSTDIAEYGRHMSFRFPSIMLDKSRLVAW
jgi:hypothetical protein